jgi:hypothetical protein
MAGHTPGKWKAIRRPGGWYYIVEGDNESDWTLIATTGCTAYEQGNAHLITAAPDLLAALAEFVRLSDDPEATAEQWGRAKATAVKAINAATGSQT